MFQGGLTAEHRTFWCDIHRHGVALALYVRWLDLMNELDVPEPERWTENLYARPVSDPLLSLDLPLKLHGCELDRADVVGGYDIRSKGPFGGGHGVRFRALGNTAEFVLIVREGALGGCRSALIGLAVRGHSDRNGLVEPEVGGTEPWASVRTPALDSQRSCTA